jgi:hypothetical protein
VQILRVVRKLEKHRQRWVEKKKNPAALAAGFRSTRARGR